jgi:hypothetical protein
MMMQKQILTLAAVAAALTFTAPAGATGIGQNGLGAAIVDSSSQMQQVRHGCGVGRWRGPDGRGRCRRMRRGGDDAVIGIPGGPAVVIPIPGRSGWCHRRGSSNNFRC